jgi:AcrR family transcriptional regulator
MTDMHSCSTVERILDSAERLFAENGFSCTSLRAITADAKANIAAVNYHFGSKEELVRQVFQRKMAPVNKIRIDKIDEVLRKADDEGRKPEVRELFEAFIGPTFDAAMDPRKASHLVLLIGRATTEPDGAMRDEFKKVAQPAFDALHNAMLRALPGRDPREVILGLFLGLSAMGNTIMRLKTENNLQSPEILQKVRERLISFLAAGMEAG